MMVILTTCAPKDAKTILQALLNQRVVACGNIISNISSMYWWDGEIQDDEECIIFMETTKLNLQKARETLEEIHPYDVPKILHWETEGNFNYVQWLQDVTKH